MNAFLDLEPAYARIHRIRDAVHAAGYSLCLERPRLMLAYRRSQECRRLRKAHPLVRRADELAYVMAHRQPRIYEEELILGNVSSKRVAANYYPEGASMHIVEDIRRLERAVVPIRLDPREKRELLAIAARTFRDSIAWRALSRPSRIRHLLEIFTADRYIVTEVAGVGHQVANYHRIVQEGLVATDRRAADCLERGVRPDGTALDADQRAFYESVRRIITGIRQMAAKLADEAERLAGDRDCPAQRARELREAGAGLRHVPYHPARSYREGLQAAWLMHVALLLEDYEQGMSFGRLDQILWPLYQRDIASGALTREQAVELTASFQLKCCETMPVYSTRMDHYFSGHDVAQGITLGGVDADGRDVTNELSAVFLDAYDLLGTREPALHVRVHETTPAWFLERCVATLKRTGARPAFYGDPQILRAMRHSGYSEAEAREYAIIGCTELASQGRTYNSADAVLMNLPLCLELALNGGRSFAGRRRGARTPPVRAMHGMDDVVAAFRTQVQHSVDDMARVMGWLETAYRRHRTTPTTSLMTDGCLDTGRDVTWGGAEHDFTSAQCVGLADTGDSLYALNRLVFEERRYTLPELVDILRRDFAGQEALALELQRRFPHYGNGDERVDRWAQVAADAFSDAVTKHRNTRGGRWLAGFYSMTCGHAFGRFTGALPDGRRAGTRLSSGTSPVDGADRNGPSALFRSVGSLDKTNWGNAQVLNATFDCNTLHGRAGEAALSGLLRAYFLDQGGMQVQIAVLDPAALKAARDDPEAYPNLLVRVSGYCAYFADLQPEIQDEIIARTMH